MNSALIKALTKAAERYVDRNAEDLGRRAFEHSAGKLVQQQVSREMVTMLALEDLRDKPPPEPPKDTPTDDWLNLFSSYAERASSNKLREHWAQILSGEIRKPGSFSMTTLQLASVLDQKLAEAITRASAWVLDDEFIPIIGPLTVGKLYSDLVILDGVGFLRLGAGSKIYQFPATSRVGYSVGLQGSFINFQAPDGHRITIQAAFLTLAGRELLPILGRQEDAQLQTVIVNHLRACGATVSIF